MKSRTAILLAAMLGATTALPSWAAREDRRVDAMVMPSNTVHTGAATYSDQQLASDIVAAISADRAMSGTTITVVAKDGRITLNGSAKDIAQAARAEKLARDIAGPRQVVGKLDIQGG
jgi:osmotically-inducible protein OsmY